MTRLGYQIPNFTYPGVGPAELFDVVAAQAAAADRSGFDTVLVMDHFYQLPMIGPPDQYMLECYTLLAALARETTQRAAERARHRQHLPGADAAGQGRSRPSTSCRTAGPSSASAPAGSSSSTTRSASSSAPSPTASRSSRRPSRSSSAMLTRRAPVPRRHALHGERRHQRAAARRPHPDPDRWLGREEDAAHGRPVRRRVEPDLLARRGAPQARRPRRPLRAPRAATAAEITVVQAGDVLHRPDPRPGLGRGRAAWPAAWAWTSPTRRVREVAAGLIFIGGPDEVAEKLSEVLDSGVDGWTIACPANGQDPGAGRAAGPDGVEVAAPDGASAARVADSARGFVTIAIGEIHRPPGA